MQLIFLAKYVILEIEKIKARLSITTIIKKDILQKFILNLEKTRSFQKNNNSLNHLQFDN